MARALVVEEESGTTRAVRHPHNGYYAGDFSTSHQAEPTAATAVAVATGVRQQLGWAA